MNDYLGLVLGVICFVILIVIFVAISRVKKGFSTKEKNYFKQKWREIKNEKDFRHSIMTADKLLEKVMRCKGYQGTLGQMLKSGKSEFSDLNGVWYAHKIRNKLAHEIDYKLIPSEAQKGLQYFQKAFKDLGAL